MRILHLSKMDSGGGAADGFLRIHRALISQGHNSVAYVIKCRRKDVDQLIDAKRLLQPCEGFRWAAGRIVAKLKRLRSKPIGVYDFDAEANYPAEPIIRHARRIHATWDLVIVHWAGGFVAPPTIRSIATALGARVLLWQVDMAHVTGGCHSNLGCPKYRTGCGACPLIASEHQDDLSARQAQVRRMTWVQAGAILVAPTPWSASQAQESWITGTLPKRVFPIPLDLELLRPASGTDAPRRFLGIPEAARVLLVRGIHPSLEYKGFGLFLQALRLVDTWGVPLHVAILGERGLMGDGWKHITFTELGFRRGDAAIATAYQAADFFVNPSINDNGPMMVGEALVCGVPVIAFPVGLPNVPWCDGLVGRVVEPIGHVPSLAAAIRSFAEMPEDDIARRKRAAAEASRSLYSVSHFTSELQAALRELPVIKGAHGSSSQ